MATTSYRSNATIDLYACGDRIGSMSSAASSLVLTEMRHINVTVLERTQMACELMAHAIESSCDEIRVITTGVSSEFYNDAEVKKADVALISLALKDDPSGWLKLLRRLVVEKPNVNCILLLDEGNREIVVEAFRSGAVGVCVSATKHIFTSVNAFAA